MSQKTFAVRYLSRSGNTKKLAESIADTVECKAQTIDKPIQERVDVLFLGASVYGGAIDKQVKDFISSLDARKVGKVAIFSTSALAERAYPQISKLLQERSIEVIKDDFYCRGKFTVLHRNRPNSDDIKAAADYAKKICANEQV